MKIRIENSYTDGHESESVVEIFEEPSLDMLDADYDGPEDWDGADWWQGVVYEYTGDGHGAAVPGLGSCYIATIVEADNAALVGKSNEWLD